ncbi:MAG TPA: hypothetical protein VKK79_19225 [Candidatus Lokiarchaeia archaeon]|nr:hypothetical protein [Candidatus Lokiarchaeia archaeon]
MSDQLILDSVQSIYARITNISKSMGELGNSINALKQALQDKIGKVVDQIGQMNGTVQNEGAMHADILRGIANDVTKEITKLQEEVGLRAVEDLKNNLTTIYDSVKETLRPDNVDILLAEALETIKILQGEKKSEEAKKAAEETSVASEPQDAGPEPEEKKPAKRGRPKK